MKLRRNHRMASEFLVSWSLNTNALWISEMQAMLFFINKSIFSHSAAPHVTSVSRILACYRIISDWEKRWAYCSSSALSAMSMTPRDRHGLFLRINILKKYIFQLGVPCTGNLVLHNYELSILNLEQASFLYFWSILSNILVHFHGIHYSGMIRNKARKSPSRSRMMMIRTVICGVLVSWNLFYLSSLEKRIHAYNPYQH